MPDGGVGILFDSPIEMIESSILSMFSQFPALLSIVESSAVRPDDAASTGDSAGRASYLYLTVSLLPLSLLRHSPIRRGSGGVT